MIDIDFLRTKNVGGLEYLDFQNKSFRDTLTALINEHTIDVLGVKQLSKTVEKELYKILAEYTGFKNIKLELVDVVNMAIDTGYMSPRHVLNNPMAEKMLSVRQMTLYKWFTANKDKIFMGGVDLSTGKVTGSFQELPLTLLVGRNLSELVDEKSLNKFKVSLAECIAGIICHEIGHAFGGCALMVQNVTDNFVIKTAIQEIRKETREEIRIAIIKDTRRLLEIEKDDDPKEILDIVQGPNPDQTTLLYFTRLLKRRNDNRALSLGVPEMTSEVLADVYSIRMGFDKGLIAGIYSMYKSQKISILNASLVVAGIMTGIMMIQSLPLVIGGGASFVGLFGCIGFGIFASTIWMTLYFFSQVSGTYNTGQRRFEDAMRQIIARLKVDKNIPTVDKTEMIDLIDECLKYNDAMKSVMSGTAFQRFMGWMVAGSDFKYREFEHYTQALANNELNVLGVKLENLTK